MLLCVHMRRRSCCTAPSLRASLEELRGRGEEVGEALERCLPPGRDRRADDVPPHLRVAKYLAPCFSCFSCAFAWTENL